MRLTGSGSLNAVGWTAVSAGKGGKVTVTNIQTVGDSWKFGADADGAGSVITVLGNITSGGCGAYAHNGGTVNVNGNITLVGTSSGDVGAWATDANSNITVNGAINLPAGSVYVRLGNTNRTKESGVLSTFKPGHLEYVSGTNTVWVKIPNYYDVQTSQQLTTALNAINALPAGDSGYIRLLDNITHNSGIAFSGKTVTFNTNGKKLDVVLFRKINVDKLYQI